MRKIAVIGASGFVGSTLVERLLAQGEDEVIPFIHSSGNAWRIARLGIRLMPLNLLDRHGVDAALHGVTHIVNCSRGGEDVMLAGLRNLLVSCRRNNVQRFIHLGSVAVYGDPPPPQSVHESAETRPTRGTYGWLKLQQDQMLAKACREGLHGLILCPPNISGPHSAYMIGLVDALRARRFALLEDGTVPCNLVDVANLSFAIELALKDGPRDGSRLFVTDDEPTDWRSVLDGLEALIGNADPIPHITREQLAGLGGDTPKQAVSLVRSIKHLVSSDVRQALRKDPLWERVDVALRRAVARTGSSIEDAVRLSVEGPIRVEKVADERNVDARLCRQQLRSIRHSCELAKSRLGYRPLYSFAQSIAAFRRWYSSHHGMDSPFWPLLQQLYR
jgi:nucleoside-diphosphate-sugar epimerase